MAALALALFWLLTRAGRRRLTCRPEVAGSPARSRSSGVSEHAATATRSQPWNAVAAVPGVITVIDFTVAAVTVAIV